MITWGNEAACKSFAAVLHTAWLPGNAGRHRRDYRSPGSVSALRSVIQYFPDPAYNAAVEPYFDAVRMKA